MPIITAVENPTCELLESKSQRWEAKLSAYHDDELSPAEKEDVSLHLSNCSSCRSLLADFQHISESLQELVQAEKPPHSVLEALRKRIHR